MAKINKKRLNISPSQSKFLLKTLGINKIEDIDTVVLKKLKNNMKSLTDSRQKNKRIYKIWDIAVCVILADFAGIDSWEDIPDFVEEKYDWLRSFLKLSGGIPSSQTFERVFSIINHSEFENILNTFLLSITYNCHSKKDILNIDGRVSCGSSRNETDFSEKLKPLNVLNVYSNNLNICLTSQMIDDKTNEIPNIPIVLERLNIQDVIVTWDALNTQKDNVHSVIDGGGDYVVPIKGNHPTFYDDLKTYFDDKRLEVIIAGNSKSSYLKQIEKSHSSTILYEYFQTDDIDWYYDRDSWEKLNTIGLVKKTVDKNGQRTVEYRYYISSLNLNIELFSKAIREHWNVENKLHWHLDFTFREDKNTTANKHALMNLQLVNKFCLSILSRIQPFYNNISLRRIRNKASLNFEKEFINILCYLMLS